MEFIEITNFTQTLTAIISGDPYYTYYWICLIIGGVAFLSMFALEAVALNTIAKNNGFKNRWMAFVPFLNTYYIGVLAEKNKTFNTKTKYFSLALAIIEALSVTFGILYSVAVVQLFDTNCITAIYEPIYNHAGEVIYEPFVGKYEAVNLPASLNWAWWVFTNANSYLFSLLELAYIVLLVFVLSSFFRTYSPRKYMLFTIFSVLFPIKAIFMFCVKNNKGIDYIEHVKEMQRRQYEAYQQYMRNMGGFNQGGFYGGYNGYNNNGNNGTGRTQPSKDEDPFGGLGQNSANGSNPSDDDPFGDLK